MPRRTTRSSAASIEPTQDPIAPPRKKALSPLATVVIIAMLVTAVILGAKSLLTKDKGESGKSNAPTTQEETLSESDEDIQKLIARVGKHIVLKTDENPTVATIQDAEMLRGQSPAFYKDAQNGDRLLIWSDKAVLYSPTRDVLLAVLPVSVTPTPTSTSSSATSSTEVAETASIEVRNGSTTAGRGRLMADKLIDAGLTVLPATDAKVKTYANTVIIVKDATKPLPKTLETLKAVTGAEVIEAPAVEGEIRGDFLVIVGADFTP